MAVPYYMGMNKTTTQTGTDANAIKTVQIFHDKNTQRVHVGYHTNRGYVELGAYGMSERQLAMDTAEGFRKSRNVAEPVHYYESAWKNGCTVLVRMA